MSVSNNKLADLNSSTPNKVILRTGDSITCYPGCLITWSGNDYETRLVLSDEPSFGLGERTLAPQPRFAVNSTFVVPSDRSSLSTASSSIRMDVDDALNHGSNDKTSPYPPFPRKDDPSKTSNSGIVSVSNRTDTDALTSGKVTPFNPSLSGGFMHVQKPNPESPKSSSESHARNATIADTFTDQGVNATSSPIDSFNNSQRAALTSTTLNIIPPQVSHYAAVLPTPTPPPVIHFNTNPDYYQSLPGLAQLQHAHSIELQSLITQQTLEIASLVAIQKSQIEAYLKNPLVVPHSNVQRHPLVFQAAPSPIYYTQGQHNNTSRMDEDVDVTSVDELSTGPSSGWKGAGNHRSTTSANGKKVKKKPSVVPASQANHHYHANHPHHQQLNLPLPSRPGNATPPSIDGDDPEKRISRKRKAGAEYNGDGEFEKLLAAKRSRGNELNPAPSSSDPPPTTSLKKPKPRDNVAIATILDIYSPFKSLALRWSHTKGYKTMILFHTDCFDHITPPWHLESPQRLTAVMDGIKAVREQHDPLCEMLESFPECDLGLVKKCHEDSYITKITSKIPDNRAAPPLHATQDIDISSSGLTGSMNSIIDPGCERPRDTFVSFGSWKAALLAAGAACVAIDKVIESSMSPDPIIRNAFCGVRPPGHHAGSHGHDGASTNGYCVLNSVAIAAQHAIDKWGLQRICILDFDVHQGNGTAQIVENDPRIMFISLHGSQIYPFDENNESEADRCTDHIVNVSYKTGATGKEILKLFEDRCSQVMRSFDPELIILSSGFDAHIDDPTQAAVMKVADYVSLTRTIKAIADTPTCKGRIVSVLEGGYHLRALKLCVAGHLLALMEGSIPDAVARRREIAAEEALQVPSDVINPDVASPPRASPAVPMETDQQHHVSIV